MRLPRILLLLSLAAAGPARADEARLAELERRLDVLARELEAMRLGEAADSALYRSVFGLAPAASKVYGVRQGVSVGGYGDVLYEDFDAEREDGSPAGKADQVDFLRQIVYLGYKYDERLLFNSELEFEHASTGKGGEVSVEFAYLDWLPRRELGLRAGMVLVPVGLVNEFHEPPVVLGARRPDVESRILPTTWRANGAGIVGQLPAGLAYRAYVVEGLNFAGFKADEALRGGRQSGARAKVEDAALTARLDWSSVPGLLAGASVFRGGTGQGAADSLGALRAPVTVWEVHGRFQRGGLEARALWAEGRMEDAGRVNARRALAGGSALGGAFHGGYLEASLDVLPWITRGTTWAFAPHLRLERYDTQEHVPAGGVDDPTNARRVLSVGAALKPHPNVVVKADRQLRSNEADTETSQWNVALGYLF